jgi:hypothetical protein
MKPEFVIWDSMAVPNACVLAELYGVDKQYELDKGIPRLANFPKNARFKMDSDFPHDTLLVDNLDNTDDLIVASRRLKEFLETRPLMHMEYLPIAILDHKKKPVEDEYFIVHPIDLPECLDIKKSQVTWGISKDWADKVKQLVIDMTKVEPDRDLFRPKPFYSVILVRRALAEAIDEQGFTGIRWKEIDDYPHPRTGGKR